MKKILFLLFIFFINVYSGVFDSIDTSINEKNNLVNQKKEEFIIREKNKQKEEYEEQQKWLYSKKENQNIYANSSYLLEDILNQDVTSIEINKNVNYDNYLLLNTKNLIFNCNNNTIKNLHIINNNSSSINFKNCNKENIIEEKIIQTKDTNSLNLKKEGDLLKVYTEYISVKQLKEVSNYLNNDLYNYTISNSIVSHIYCNNHSLNNLRFNNSNEIYFHNCYINNIDIFNNLKKAKIIFIDSYIKNINIQDTMKEKDSILTFKNSYLKNIETNVNNINLLNINGIIFLKNDFKFIEINNSKIDLINLNSNNVKIIDSEIQNFVNQNMKSKYFIENSKIRSNDFMNFDSFIYNSKIITNEYNSIGESVVIKSKILSHSEIAKTDDIIIDSIYYNISPKNLEKFSSKIFNSYLFTKDKKEIEDTTFNFQTHSYFDINKNYNDNFEYIKDFSKMNDIKVNNKIFDKYKSVITEILK